MSFSTPCVRELFNLNSQNPYAVVQYYTGVRMEQRKKRHRRLALFASPLFLSSSTRKTPVYQGYGSPLSDTEENAMDFRTFPTPLFIVIAIFILSFLTHVTPSHSHGMMCEPRHRAAYLNNQKCETQTSVGRSGPRDYCGHCLNGGGTGTVGGNIKNGWTKYDPINNPQESLSRAGLCGDPLGNNDHMLGGKFMQFEDNLVPIVGLYKKNKYIDIRIEIDTNHNGYFEFFLCNLDRCKSRDLEVRCFEEGHCHRLERMKSNKCEKSSIDTTQECGPIDKSRSDYKGRFYVPCRKTAHVGVHLIGGKNKTMRYKLPKNLICKHCVLQWYWVTANSCNPPGQKEYFAHYDNPFGTTCPSDGGGLGAHNPALADCGGDKVPEEFWSCADIQIRKGNKKQVDVTIAPDPSPSASPSTTTGATPSGTSNSTPNPTPDSTPSTTPSSSPRPSPNEDGDKEDNDDENDDDDKDDDDDGDDDDGDDGSNDGDGDNNCFEMEEHCDGLKYCCDNSAVCVYRTNVDKFVCFHWWALWKEVEDRKKESE